MPDANPPGAVATGGETGCSLPPTTATRRSSRPVTAKIGGHVALLVDSRPTAFPWTSMSTDAAECVTVTGSDGQLELFAIVGEMVHAPPLRSANTAPLQSHAAIASPEGATSSIPASAWHPGASVCDLAASAEAPTWTSWTTTSEPVP